MKNYLELVDDDGTLHKVAYGKITRGTFNFVKNTKTFDPFNREHMCIHSIDGVCELCGHINKRVRDSYLKQQNSPTGSHIGSDGKN